MARKPRGGRGGKSSKPPKRELARKARVSSDERGNARAKPPVRDLDQLEIEQAHASGEHATDLILDEDDELTQWQADPRQAKIADADLSLSDDGEDLLHLDDDTVAPLPVARASMDTLSSDDSFDDDLDVTLLSGDADGASQDDEGGAPALPNRGPSGELPQAPLVNPFSTETESSKPQIYFDHSVDPDEEPPPMDLSMDDDVLEIHAEHTDDSLLLDDEPSGPPSRMDLVHVSLDPDDPEAALSLEDDMETDLLDLTPAGTSYDELERLEHEVERLEDEDRLDEALSALRQLQRQLPTDSDLQYRYEELQQKVIQSYFPGKNRDSVVHLAVETVDLPELIKTSESELGSLLSRMDGATALGDLDLALGDLDPGTLYRMLSRAKGKGLVRLD